MARLLVLAAALNVWVLVLILAAALAATLLVSLIYMVWRKKKDRAPASGARSDPDA